MQVVLNYSSQVDGEVSITSGVSSGGYYEFVVSIDEAEPLGLMDAAISFDGWHLMTSITKHRHLSMSDPVTIPSN